MKALSSLLTVLLVLVSISVAPAQVDPNAPIDPAKEAEIRKLIELSGAVKSGEKVIDQMLSQFKATHPELSDETFARIREKIDMQGLMEDLIPVYAKYYTLGDLQALNAFYSSPAGQHMIAAQPLILQESMKAGMKWGQDLGKTLGEEVIKAKTAEAPAN